MSVEQLFKALPHPCGWLNYDALDANIEFVKAHCGDKQIRIATKSVRSVEALRYIASKLDNISGYMTFTADETLYLLKHGFNQLLLGYPVYEPEAIRQLLEAQKDGADVTFMVDHIDQLQLLNGLAKRTGFSASVCIDLNVSTQFPLLYFGTKRSPIYSLPTLDALVQQLKTLPNIRVSGVMAYDAQIAGVTDIASSTNAAIKASIIRQLKNRSLEKITAFRQFAVAHVKAHFNIAFVNGGGSGSMSYCAQERDLTEITVGSAFFAPALFDYYASLQLKPATGFALRVTRKFAPDIAVCHGGGYIASGAPGKDRLPQFFRDGQFAFLPLEGAGEVQTPIRIHYGTVEIGDTILLRHAKAGELCERFDKLYTIRAGQLVGEMTTYRGDGQCFL